MVCARGICTRRRATNGPSSIEFRGDAPIWEDLERKCGAEKGLYECREPSGIALLDVAAVCPARGSIADSVSVSRSDFASFDAIVDDVACSAAAIARARDACQPGVSCAI